MLLSYLFIHYSLCPLHPSSIVGSLNQQIVEQILEHLVYVLGIQLNNINNRKLICDRCYDGEERAVMKSCNMTL